MFRLDFFNVLHVLPSSFPSDRQSNGISNVFFMCFNVEKRLSHATCVDDELKTYLYTTKTLQ